VVPFLHLLSGKPSTCQFVATDIVGHCFHPSHKFFTTSQQTRLNLVIESVLILEVADVCNLCHSNL
jgi:hypothetical protein